MDLLLQGDSAFGLINSVYYRMAKQIVKHYGEQDEKHTGADKKNRAVSKQFIMYTLLQYIAYVKF